jgi:hypothetical protein
MKELGWRQWTLLLSLVLTVAIVCLFAFRAFEHIPHRRVDEPIRPWMSVPYIAHSYHVPPHVLFQAIGLPRKPPDKRPIKQIARAQNRPVEDLIKDLQDAIIRTRSSYPPPDSRPDEGRAP